MKAVAETTCDVGRNRVQNKNMYRSPSLYALIGNTHSTLLHAASA